MKDSRLQRTLSKVSEYPRWATFNIVSAVLVTICILVSAPLFVKVWKPQNETDSSKIIAMSTVHNDTLKNSSLPGVEANNTERVQVS